MIYIIIEGGDFSGKTTLIDGLKHHQNRINGSIKFVREPSNESLRPIIKSDKTSPECRSILLSADRALGYDLLRSNSDQDVVISDRGYISNLVYQVDYDKIMEESVFHEIMKMIGAGIPEPLVILLDPSSEAIDKRRKHRVFAQGDIYDNIPVKGVEEIRTFYRRRVSEVRNRVIITSDDAVEVLEGAIKEINEFIQRSGTKNSSSK